MISVRVERGVYRFMIALPARSFEVYAEDANLIVLPDLLSLISTHSIWSQAVVVPLRAVLIERAVKFLEDHSNAHFGQVMQLCAIEPIGAAIRGAFVLKVLAYLHKA